MLESQPPNSLPASPERHASSARLLSTPQRVWLLPSNLVTELRLALTPLMATFFWLHRPGWAASCFAVAALSDGADGWLARRRGEVSRLGLVLDPLADKLLMSTLFISLTLLRAFPLRLTLLGLVRDFSIVTVALVLYFVTGFSDFRPSRLGKLNTFMEMVTASATLFYLLWPVAWLFIFVQVLWIVAWILIFASGSHYALLCGHRYRAWRIENTGIIA